jgi:hypothetical protein
LESTIDQRLINAICAVDLTGVVWSFGDRLLHQGELTEATKLKIEPLSLEEVSKYLVAGGSKLVALRGAVNTDPVLKELAHTPLMLSVISLAYQEAEVMNWPPKEGIHPTSVESRSLGSTSTRCLSGRNSPSSASERENP